MIILFTFTIFLSACLLFVVQPMFGRLLLPLLGGAPAVWNTCMVFFQAALLAGYAYAHLISTRLAPRGQVLVHGLLLVAALIALPVAIPSGWTPPVDGNPVGWLLGTAAVAVGLPFFVVSATSPLLQRWLSLTRHPAARDPYFLYAASNLGSLLALLGYPLLMEPRLGLAQQSRWWAVGYAGCVVALLACGVVMARRSREPTGLAATPEPVVPAVAPTWRERGFWVLLAFVPSSLMLSVTNYITMDLAAIPLLWVIPLAIYLATFSLAFSRQRALSLPVSARWLRLALVLVVTTLALRASAPIGLLILLHLFGLFAAAMVCHQQLAVRRPAPQFLTQFYFWIALGGVLGGAFNALVAPVVFVAVTEYPLGLWAVSWLLPAVGQPGAAARKLWRELAWPVGLAVGCGLLLAVAQFFPAVVNSIGGRLVIVGTPALVCLYCSRHRLRFALGLLVLFVVGRNQAHQGNTVLFAERSFFGIHRVETNAERQLHWLFHGTTVHGIQWQDAARRGEPLAYYSRTGPLGQIMDVAGPARRQTVALVGLGAGGASCYAQPGEQWTYFEIDPVVEKVARDPQFFSYLNDAPAGWAIVLGDARLTLRTVPAQHYGLIVLDAYNSDAIPLHLVTREALALYGEKLRPDGILAWHITNRHLDLEPVLAALAEDGGWVCVLRDDQDLTPAEIAARKAPSRWAVMTRTPAALGSLVEDPRWQPARRRPDVKLWTDDYANLFRVLRWRDP